MRISPGAAKVSEAKPVRGQLLLQEHVVGLYRYLMHLPGPVPEELEERTTVDATHMG